MSRSRSPRVRRRLPGAERRGQDDNVEDAQRAAPPDRRRCARARPPIGIAVTVPAQAVAGRLDGLGLLAMLVGTLAVWLFAGWFWQLGLRNYTGASA